MNRVFILFFILTPPSYWGFAGIPLSEPLNSDIETIKVTGVQELEGSNVYIRASERRILASMANSCQVIGPGIRNAQNFEVVGDLCGVVTAHDQ